MPARAKRSTGVLQLPPASHGWLRVKSRDVVYEIVGQGVGCSGRLKRGDSFLDL
jgi:hypothetical protein